MPKKGYVPTKEHRNKLSLAKKGDKNVLERISRFSFKKGFDERRFWKGATHTEETKKKMLRCDTRNGHYLCQQIRGTGKYIRWKNEVFLRDGKCCVWCKSEKNLDIDHIISVAEILEKLKFEKGVENLWDKAMEYELLWDTSNGRTLCRKCHLTTPTWGSRNASRSRKRL